MQNRRAAILPPGKPAKVLANSGAEGYGVHNWFTKS
jgi:hypothetical protein